MWDAKSEVEERRPELAGDVREIPPPTIAHAFGAIRQHEKLNNLKISQIGLQNETTLNIAQRILETENMKLVQQILKIERNTNKHKRKYKYWLKKFDKIPHVLPMKSIMFSNNQMPKFNGGDNFNFLNPFVCGFAGVPEKYNTHERIVHRLRLENVNLEREKKFRRNYKHKIKNKIAKIKASYNKRIKELKIKMAGESVIVLAQVVNQVNHHKRRAQLKKEYEGKNRLFIDWCNPDAQQRMDEMEEANDISRLGEILETTAFPSEVSRLEAEIEEKKRQIQSRVQTEMNELTQPIRRLSGDIDEARQMITERLQAFQQ